MQVTIGEEVLLLSRDSATGAVRRRTPVSVAVSGGSLLELAFSDRVMIHGNKLVLRSTAPTGLPLLDQQLMELSRLPQHPEWFAPRVVGWLRRHSSRSIRVTGASLLARGVVYESYFLGSRRYPERDRHVEQMVRARLARVVLNGEQPDARTGGLIALLHHAKLHRLAFPYLHPGQVKQPMAKISHGDWAGESVRKAIHETATALVGVAAAAGAASGG